MVSRKRSAPTASSPPSLQKVKTEEMDTTEEGMPAATAPSVTATESVATESLATESVAVDPFPVDPSPVTTAVSAVAAAQQPATSAPATNPPSVAPAQAPPAVASTAAADTAAPASAAAAPAVAGTLSTPASARLTADKGSTICAFPLSGPWISSHTIHPTPVVIKRPEQVTTAKWGMNIYHDITQWGKDWGVVMISSPGPQRTLAIGDIILGVNGISLGGKTFTEAVSLLKDAGVYCHLAVARFSGFMTVIVEVPTGVNAGDLILAKCPDGTNVDVKVPEGLRPGDRFQLQIRQPQYNSEAALLSNNAAKANTAGGAQAAQQQAAQAQQQYMQQHKAYQEQQQRFQQQQQQLLAQQQAQAQAQAQAILQQQGENQGNALQNQQLLAQQQFQQQQLLLQQQGKTPFVLQDAITVASGDFTQQELRLLIEGVRSHGMDFTKSQISTRTPAASKQKWDQVVSKFNTLVGAAQAKELEEKEKDLREIVEANGESKRKTSKQKKEADAVEREQKAHSTLVDKQLAQGIASAAPSLTVCVVSAITTLMEQNNNVTPTAAELLRYISCTWGATYFEPSHPDWSYRLKCLPKLATEGVSNEFVANPIAPDCLSFQGSKFVVDEAGCKALKDGTAELELMIMVHELICNRTNLQTELNLLAAQGVVTYDNTGGYSLAENWTQALDLEVLVTMGKSWGGKDKKKFVVADSVRERVDKMWKKKSGGWCRRDETAALFTNEMMEMKDAYLALWEKARDEMAKGAAQQQQQAQQQQAQQQQQ